jgi:ribosomal protein L29
MAKKKEDVNFGELSKDELRVKLQDSRDKLFQLRCQNATAPLKNHREIRTTRWNIARAMTFLKQKGDNA